MCTGQITHAETVAHITFFSSGGGGLVLIEKRPQMGLTISSADLAGGRERSDAGGLFGGSVSGPFVLD